MLDRDSVAAVDSTAQFAEVLGLGTHMRDALWRVESSRRPLPWMRPAV
jgi:hypothetical protein